MVRKIRASWEENDAFTGWRNVLHWQAGELKRIKRRAAKHDRRDAQAEILAILSDENGERNDPVSSNGRTSGC